MPLTMRRYDQGKLPWALLCYREMGVVAPMEKSKAGTIEKKIHLRGHVHAYTQTRIQIRARKLAMPRITCATESP